MQRSWYAKRRLLDIRWPVVEGCRQDLHSQQVNGPFPANAEIPAFTIPCAALRQHLGPNAVVMMLNMGLPASLRTLALKSFPNRQQR